MLPLHRTVSFSSQFVPEYICRVFLFPQMDFEYCFWQMLYLCLAPSRVYKTTSWHKQTKNQWARDDPAFVVVLVFFLAMASLAYAVAFRMTGLVVLFRLLFGSVFVDFLGVGVVVASLGWWLANKRLRYSQGIHSVEQEVEWLYAFDVHCNSFFPLFLVLYVVQFFLLPFLMSPSFIATIVGNSLYALAFAYYHYVTFLGYSALPFLQNTVLFLYPIAAIAVAYVISLLFNFNMTLFVMTLYFG